jgi:hypothetical protein
VDIGGATKHACCDLALPPNAPTDPCTVLFILYRATDGGEMGRVQLPSSP